MRARRVAQAGGDCVSQAIPVQQVGACTCPRDAHTTQHTSQRERQLLLPHPKDEVPKQHRDQAPRESYIGEHTGPRWPQLGLAFGNQI